MRMAPRDGRGRQGENKDPNDPLLLAKAGERSRNRPNQPRHTDSKQERVERDHQETDQPCRKVGKKPWKQRSSSRVPQEHGSRPKRPYMPRMSKGMQIGRRPEHTHQKNTPPTQEPVFMSHVPKRIQFGKYHEKSRETMPRRTTSWGISTMQAVWGMDNGNKLRETQKEMLPKPTQIAKPKNLQSQVCRMPTMYISTSSHKPGQTPSNLQKQKGGERTLSKRVKAIEEEEEEDKSREVEGTQQTTLVVAAKGDRPSFDIKIVTPVVSFL